MFDMRDAISAVAVTPLGLAVCNTVTLTQFKQLSAALSLTLQQRTAPQKAPHIEKHDRAR